MIAPTHKIDGFYVRKIKRQFELSATENVLANKMHNEEWKNENAVYSYPQEFGRR